MKPDPLKAISVPQEPVSAVRDALCSFSGVCGIYPHRDGTVPKDQLVSPDSPKPLRVLSSGSSNG